MQQKIQILSNALKMEKELGNVEKYKKSMSIKTLTPHKPMNAPSNQMYDGSDGWQLLSIIIDSGAAETVIPYKQIKGYKI